MSVFSDLADATIAKQAAERNFKLVRQQAEQKLIEEAGGVKHLGPNIVDQERAFAVLLLDDQDVLLADAELAGAEAAYERAKAAVREFECEAGRAVLFHG